MAQQLVLEGTPQELAPYLAQYPNQRFQLTALSTKEKEPASLLDEAKPVIDAKNAAAIAYLERRLQEEATDDPEEIRKSEEDYEELKRNLNANRAATGESLVFP